MGARERVHRAIEASVADADKTLSQTPNAGDHERLTILVDGWFQGLAGALEELAVEIDLLRESRHAGEPIETDRVERSVEEPSPRRERAEAERPEAPVDEAALAERARASRAETEAVRAETHPDGNDDTTEKED